MRLPRTGRVTRPHPSPAPTGRHRGGTSVQDAGRALIAGGPPGVPGAPLPPGAPGLVPPGPLVRPGPAGPPLPPAGGMPMATFVAVTEPELSVPKTATCSPTVRSASSRRLDVWVEVGSRRGRINGDGAAILNCDGEGAVSDRFHRAHSCWSGTTERGPLGFTPGCGDPVEEEGEAAAPATVPPATANPRAIAAALMTRTPLRRLWLIAGYGSESGSDVRFPASRWLMSFSLFDDCRRGRA